MVRRYGGTLRCEWLHRGTPGAGALVPAPPDTRSITSSPRDCPVRPTPSSPSRRVVCVADRDRAPSAWSALYGLLSQRGSPTVISRSLLDQKAIKLRNIPVEGMFFFLPCSSRIAALMQIPVEIGLVIFLFFALRKAGLHSRARVLAFLSCASPNTTPVLSLTIPSALSTSGVPRCSSLERQSA